MPIKHLVTLCSTCDAPSLLLVPSLRLALDYICNDTQEQEKKQRIRGIEAQKANIQAAKTISRMLQSSLGPKGMDKMLQSGDGDVCISGCPALFDYRFSSGLV